jgi:hypothetical protein
MHVVFHLGVHCTDEDRLLRALLRNRGPLAAEGVAVPGPARYRTLIRDTLQSLKGEVASAETQAHVLDQVLEGGAEGVRRLVLSSDSFIAYPQWAIRGAFYPNAGQRLRAMADVFPDHSAEFHLAIRNPASLLPALLAKQRDRSLSEVLEGTDPLLLRWSDMVAGIRRANPGTPLIVWCDEDTPLLWPEILRGLSGHSEGFEMDGADEFLASLMTDEGMARLRLCLAGRPDIDALQRRAIVSDFLDRFALPERMEVEVDLPGWTGDYVSALSRAYDMDVARLARMEGVSLMLP